jgi:hypothetical protein
MACMAFISDFWSLAFTRLHDVLSKKIELFTISHNKNINAN